jgi:hypothetical protein
LPSAFAREAGRVGDSEFSEGRTARYFNTRLPGIQRAV